IQTSNTITGLLSGTYTCTITDANGCQDSITQILQPLPALSSTISVIEPSCFGFSDGMITVNTSNGFPGYAYVWNTNPIQTTSSIAGLSAGSYVLRTQDTLTCSRWDTVQLAEPAVLHLIDSAISPSCYNGSDGSISLFISGGT